MTEKRHFYPIPLRNQIPIEPDEADSFIELYAAGLYFQTIFVAQEPKDSEDHSLGWTEEFNHFKIFATKANIAGVEKNLTAGGKMWVLTIYVSGFAKDLSIYFKREKEAQSMFDFILDYLKSDHGTQ